MEILCSYPIKFKLCAIVDYVKYIMNMSLSFFFCLFVVDVVVCRACSRDTFPRFKKKKKSLFLGHCLSKIFQTLQDYSFTQGLHFHCMFDDLDFVEGHMSARNMKCKLDFLESCLNSCLM